MSPNDYNERFYQLVRRESFYAKRLSAMNEEICKAFLNISRFLIDEGYVSNNAREVDNIVEALPEQALANMFDDDTFATQFKIALKAVNPRLSENALSGEKRQAAAIALKLLEYSKNNATYLKPGAKAPEKDAEGAGGEYNPKGREKKPVGGSGAIDASLKGKVSQTEEVETEVEEGYKAIDKKKETAMYRRAGNLARTSLSSKGKKKEEAQKKSARIVSAITRQKEDERFERIGKDPKHQNNYKEDVEIEEGMKQARANVGAGKCWDGYTAKGTKKKGGKEVPNCVKEDEIQEKKGLWDNIHAKRNRGESPAKPGEKGYPKTLNIEGLEDLLNDAIFDQITEEELLNFAFDILQEMEQEGLLSETVEYFDEILLEDRYADASATSKANARAQRKAKVMGAMKTAAGAAKKAGSAAAGRAAEMAKRTPGAVKKAAGTAAKAVGAAARGGASLAKKAAVKGAAAAGEVAGAAKGGFEAGRIKAKRQAMSQTKPQAKSSGDGDKTGGKLDSLLKDVRGGESKPAAKPAASGGSSGAGSSSGGGSSDSGTQTRKRGLLRRVGSAIKSGLKKAIGKTARGVANVSGGVAKRFGEDTEFDIVLDYLLENDVCSIDEAEEVMMELTEEEIENILTEREMTAADKKKEGELKKKYDDSGMKASMKKQYGKEEGKKIYFATIRKKAMGR